MSRPATKIAVMRPSMPDAEAVLPYLREIDRARWYSNFGPLHGRLQRRLAAHFAIDEDHLTLLANGTLGLTLALQAQDSPAGGLCAMPAWTFAATASAVVAAGLTPWFLDVDPQTWALAAETLGDRLGEAPGAVVAVMPVAPFGAPIDYTAWDDFAERLGLAVVIDSAAAFDSVRIGTTPVMVSLHATKVLSIGEGGLIACGQPDLIARIHRLSTFGFARDRAVAELGINAKLSEYGAALGLAALDRWEPQLQAFVVLAATCREAFADLDGVRLAPGFAGPAVPSTFNVDLGRPVAEAAIAALAADGIEARRWWGGGCHRHPGLSNFSRTDLAVTDRLGQSVIGLPYYLGLTEDDIGYVRDRLAAFLSRSG